MHAVIFDIDGTLLRSAADDDALYRRAIKEVLGDVQLRPSLHDYQHVSDSGILAQILLDNNLDNSLAASVKQAFVEHMHAHVDSNGPFTAVDGANEYLQRLRASSQHDIAIATGGWRDSAILKLESSGIDYAGIPFATSDDAAERTSIMTTARKQMAAACQTVTYFGDGVWDQRACHQLSWNFVAVGTELGGIQSYRSLPLP